jgi:alginate O-acetyltransferase complex protein AlgI
LLFNSFPFILLFLPATTLGYLAIGELRPNLASAWLVGASLVFYAYWDPRYLPLLLISAVANFLFGHVLTECPPQRPQARKGLLALSLIFNLALLGYFKYANFFIANLESLTGIDFVIGKVILPLGISFFTFTQIAFLVDVYRGEAREPRFLHYLLFVTYFPHLIAGPILHHKEMMPQFARRETYRFNAANLVTGVVIFAMGLVKKVAIADSVATFVAPAYDAAAHGLNLSMLDAWGSSLAYTFQLYFDFSGYCDMAIGASLLFGIALPLNFDSPYKSLSIIEFWRRWHLTLSRFLRDYLYIPLGGNRKGSFRRYINLLVTMLLGGLWHGAGWTFVFWGGLHGLYLAVNHGFAAMRARLWESPPSVIGRAASWFVTFLAVVVAWVFFRANSLSAALHIVKAMIGLSPCGASIGCAGDAGFFHAAAGAEALCWLWCGALLLVVIVAPNTQEILRDHLAGLTQPKASAKLFGRPLAFRTSPSWAVAVGAVLAIGLVCLPKPTSFLYFNF